MFLPLRGATPGPFEHHSGSLEYMRAPMLRFAQLLEQGDLIADERELVQVHHGHAGSWKVQGTQQLHKLRQANGEHLHVRQGR